MIKVNTAVKEVAEKEGYDYVYEVTTLLYAEVKTSAIRLEKIRDYRCR